MFTYLSVTDTQFSLVLVIEYTLYNFNYSKLVEDWFQPQNIFYLGQCPMSSWKECIFCYCWDGVFCKYQLDQFGWWCCSAPLYPYWFFCLLDRSSKENTDKCDLEWWATCHCSHSCNPRPSSALRRWAAEALGSFFQVDSPTPPDQYLNCKVVGLRHNVTTFKSRVIRTVNVAFAAGGDRAAESIEWVLEVAKKRFPFI